MCVLISPSEPRRLRAELVIRDSEFGLSRRHSWVIGTPSMPARSHWPDLTSCAGFGSLVAFWHRRWLRRLHRGRTPILIIDEAHELDTRQLETLRKLTNFDYDSATCFATLLVGQPALRMKLTLGVLAALDQRITIRARLDPMTREETASYISHHLSRAGRAATLFSDDAITLIHDTSRGLPRTTNNLAVSAIIAACAAGSAIVDQTAARTAITEITETP